MVHRDSLPRSDAVTVSGWEAFSLKKAGDLGSRLQYLIVPVLDGSLSGYPIFANNGGNLTQNTLSYYTDSYTPSNWARFTLIQQPNGSYGVQTATTNYLTAVMMEVSTSAPPRQTTSRPTEPRSKPGSNSGSLKSVTAHTLSRPSMDTISGCAPSDRVKIPKEDFPPTSAISMRP